MGIISAHTVDAVLDPPTAAGEAENLIPADLVREQLRRIAESAGFPATERSRKLLDYLVRETLAGRANRIKAYCIGTAVFGRPESFDPQKDPIVRIEAARLRRDLEHYYLTDGKADPVIIDIPKGSYIPRFVTRETSDSLVAPAAAVHSSERGGRLAGLDSRWIAVIGGLSLAVLGALAFSFAAGEHRQQPVAAVQMPGLLVTPLADLTHSADSAILAQGLTERIIEKTSRFKELAVIAGAEGEGRAPTSVARYEFGGTLRDDGGHLLVQTRLVDRVDGRVIWADSFDVELKPQKLFDVELAVADQIATRIAEPSGIVFQAERRMLMDAPPDSMDAYLCTLSAYAYRATSGASKFPGVRACLERAVAEHPDYATAWALLSLAYVDEYRFLYAPPPEATEPPLVRAYEAARRATDLDPANVRAQQALMMTLFFRKDYAAAIDVGARALAINPNDVELKGEYGYRLALTGNWADGCKLVQQAIDGSARKIAYLTTALALCHFYGNDLTEAASLIAQADAPENPAYHVMAAAILAAAGEADASAQHRDWLARNAPKQTAQLLIDLPQRLVRDEDRKRFTDALRKAGFPGL